MSKTEQVDVTMPGIAIGSEEGTCVAKSGRFNACQEPIDFHHFTSIDMQTSNDDRQPLPDAQIVTSQPENKQNDSTDVKSAPPISNSSNSLRKIGYGNVDPEISNQCSISMQTKKIDLESIKDKNTNGRRKKRKEMLLKASG